MKLPPALIRRPSPLIKLVLYLSVFGFALLVIVIRTHQTVAMSAFLFAIYSFFVFLFLFAPVTDRREGMATGGGDAAFRPIDNMAVPIGDFGPNGDQVVAFFQGLTRLGSSDWKNLSDGETWRRVPLRELLEQHRRAKAHAKIAALMADGVRKTSLLSAEKTLNFIFQQNQVGAAFRDQKLETMLGKEEASTSTMLLAPAVQAAFIAAAALVYRDLITHAEFAALYRPFSSLLPT